MKLIFPSQWNESQKEWTVPKVSFYVKLKLYIKSLLKLPNSKLRVPNVFIIEQFLKQKIVIDENNLGITTLIFNTSDPDSGKKILSKLNFLADEIVKERIRTRSIEYSKFLLGQLDKTLNKDQRLALINALSVQQSTQMMSSTYLPFAAEKFGEVYSSDGPNKPRPIKFCYYLLYLGFLLAF